MNREYTDVLVIGGGIAGLEAAYTARKLGAEVTLLAKGGSASPKILGFNAPVGPDDSVALFCADTLKGGWGLGDPELIEELAEGSVETARQMEALGMRFDREEGNEKAYQLLKPLGCAAPRLLHQGNTTGRDSMAFLKQAAQTAGVRFLEGWMALKLLQSSQGVRGALAISLNTMTPVIFEAAAVVLCCGGAHLMENSTYPLDQTADGYAMAWEAGASLRDMEFIQHEPCRAVYPRPLGLSTTLLSKGGVLTNQKGERFVLRAYAREGDAPKDQLARLIAQEILAGNGTPHGGVYLDLTALPPGEIKEKHSLYYHRFLDAGIDLTRQIVEVGPAAHSIMGGVSIAPDASAGVCGLYAAGEVTGGIHGANRLGGTAGAETYVFGRIAGQSAAKYAKEHPLLREEAASLTLSADDLPAPGGGEEGFYETAIKKARSLLAGCLGPVRDGQGLSEALPQLKELQTSCAAPGQDWPAQKKRREALNLLCTGEICCRAALKREESRGVHFRSDFPDRDDARFGHSILLNRKGEAT